MYGSKLPAKEDREKMRQAVERRLKGSSERPKKNNEDEVKKRKNEAPTQGGGY